MHFNEFRAPLPMFRSMRCPWRGSPGPDLGLSRWLRSALHMYVVKGCQGHSSGKAGSRHSPDKTCQSPDVPTNFFSPAQLRCDLVSWAGGKSFGNVWALTRFVIDSNCHGDCLKKFDLKVGLPASSRRQARVDVAVHMASAEHEPHSWLVSCTAQ